MQTPVNVLVLCTGNSTRSILAEVLINELGKGVFRAFSAGSQPAGRVNPGAIDKLEREGLATTGLASKSWERFSGPGAPDIDIVITVCDNAASEPCPVWPGGPVTVHWGIPDPAAVTGDDAERRAAFDAAYAALKRRIDEMVGLPVETLSREALAQALATIHELAS
jgi:arsenate reductase